MIQLPDGQLIPTEPAEFDTDLLRNELVKLEALKPKLQAYWQREFRDIPKALQDQVRAIPLIHPPTEAGLEQMYGIIWQLLDAIRQIKQLLNGESIRADLEKSLGFAPSTPAMIPAGSAPSAEPTTLSIAAAPAPSAPAAPTPQNESGSTLSIPTPIPAPLVAPTPSPKPESGPTLTLPQ